MKVQHLSEDRCLDYLTGELRAEERAEFAGHLELCCECRVRMEQYRELLRVGLPSIANEVAIEFESEALPWPVEKGEKKLHAALEGPDGVRASDPGVLGLNTTIPKTANPWHLTPARIRIGAAIAATVLVGFVLADSIYRVGVRHGREQFHAVQQQVVSSDDEVLRAELAKLRQERDKLQAGLQQRGSLVAQLKSEINQQRRQSELTQASLESANQQSTEQVQAISSQLDELARRLEDQQALLAIKQREFDSVQKAHSSDALRLVSLENRIQQMTDVLKEKDSRLDERERMLERGRDIRDLVVARDLYMANVYEVGANGQKKKAWGRVFLTKGKSLIFYGYDLDQEPGFTTASTFQAWGNRGPDRKNALNLGIMYVDSTANRRWALQIDDPKQLAEINAVFITVEPDGQSRFPRGKEVLFAYLKEEPNHP